MCKVGIEVVGATLKIWGRMILFTITALVAEAHAGEFSVLTWNIQKGETRGWSELLKVYQPDIFLAQEVTTNPSMVLLPLESELGGDFKWVMNPAWMMSDGYATGTLNASRFESVYHELLLSHDVEPIASTPKSMLVTDYIIPRCGQVRVINLHMLNFNLGPAYRRQLEQLDAFIETHSGPLIVAGDFNSWNGFRENTLFTWSERLGLTHVEMVRHTWFFVLDHVFYKNLTLLDSEEIPSALSDHNPLRTQFRCP